MIEAQKDQQDGQILPKTPEDTTPKDHPMHKDNMPKHLYKYDGGFSGSAVVVGSAEFVDGKVIQERAIEFRDRDGKPVWTDLQHTIPLSITLDDVRYTRAWLEEKYKPNHNTLIRSRRNPTEYNTYPEPESIDATLTTFEEMLGIHRSSE